MATSEERMQILRMIQEGKISAEEGAKLLSALKGQRREEDAGRESASWLRLRVTDARSGRSKVNVNLPMSLANSMLKLAARFIPEDADVGLDELRTALNSGARGKIFEADMEEDNQHLEVFVE
jgi:hypothetical protein